MAFYRRKPQMIEARLVFSYMEMPAIVGWIEENGGRAVYGQQEFGGAEILLTTASGMAIVRPGEYILRIGNGVFETCKVGVFEALYERA